MKKRASGILLHITSLPSRYGIGDLGPEAYEFVDFLVRAKQSYWQVLPLTRPAFGLNPYNALSAFAGNTLLISPELLYRQGLLTKKDIQDRPIFPKGHVDYHRAISYKTKLLNVAFERFKTKTKDPEYKLFCSGNENWLENFAMFIALREHFGCRLWCDWPAAIRDKKALALEFMRGRLQDAVEKEKFLQYLFFKQWFSLKRYSNEHGVRIIGDIPIYIAYNSADVWAWPEIFKLTKAKKLKVVSGVPPDFFSRTGQLWGNPIYDWKALKDAGYRWWVQRVKHNLALFDIVRIDHFRGFIAYWEVPANQKTAVVGKWVDGPKEDFFNTLLKHFPSLPIVVEDLGYITADVREFIEKFGLMCMRVLLFAFDGDIAKNLHCPHNHVENSIVYTGTHDNNTIEGWFEKEAKPEQKKKLFDYLGRKVSAGQIHWELIQLAMSSVGRVVIIPMQDVLGLGERARMNRPATVRGNWRWQLLAGQTRAVIARRLGKLTEIYGRM